MSDSAERKSQLLSVLTDLVNDRTENASVTMSSYIQAKTQDILGGNRPAVAEVAPEVTEPEVEEES